MAGALTVRRIINSTGLGEEFTIDIDAVTQTVPVEHGGKGRYVIHHTATTTALQLSTLFPQLALAKIYKVYIKAEVGTIYIMLNTAGATTFGVTTADLALAEGEDVDLPVNPDLTAANGMTIDAAAVTDAFTITAWAKT